LTHARPGVRERHVFAQMMFANADAGGSFCPMVGWASGPMGRAYHRLEQPSFRTLRSGDVLALEIEGRWGGYIAQIDQVSAIGEPRPDWGDAAKLTWEAFDRVFEKLRPGVTMAELIETATFGGLHGRAKTGLGMHGRGLGDDGPLLVAGRPEPKEVLDITIDEGCVFVVKPSATVDGVGDYYRWGDSVAVTSSGARRLGTRPQALTILK
jgi:Xaa-Pro aminopeptidase